VLYTNEGTRPARQTVYKNTIDAAVDVSCVCGFMRVTTPFER
jgi:hypothetical protein